MARKLQKKNYKKILAYDLGGTKICAAVVDERGQILSLKKEPVDLSVGLTSLVKQFARLGLPLIKEYKLKTGAIASAGPLDPTRGELLNATNFKTKGKSWGVVPLISEVEKKLKIKLRLENDAAAAAWAEHWVGAGQKIKNLVIVTLGTGVGVGVIANGQLVRSGRNLHPEAGHLTLDYQDREWLCGCGNYGCAEAFLSGKNFTKQMAKKLGDPQLTGERLVELARTENIQIQNEFKIYGERLAAFIHSLVVMFSPEKVVLSGGFSHAADLFLPVCELKLSQMLQSRREGYDLLPQIMISPFQDEAGVLGAAYVAHKL